MKLVEAHGAPNVLVVLGAPDPESAEIAAETVISGDPSYAGPLAGVQLGLEVRHILEEDVKKAIPAEIWDREIGIMTDVLDSDAIASAVTRMREQGSQS